MILKSSGETVEGTVSHFRGASICLLVNCASTVAMDGFARATLWTNQYNYNVNGVPVATVRVQLAIHYSAISSLSFNTHACSVEVTCKHFINNEHLSFQEF